jgi:hypothetical protein
MAVYHYDAFWLRVRFDIPAPVGGLAVLRFFVVTAAAGGAHATLWTWFAWNRSHQLSKHKTAVSQAEQRRRSVQLLQMFL